MEDRRQVVRRVLPPALAGFTLIELLVVLAILGVLAAAAMPLGETLLVAQKERELRRALHEIRSALDDYHTLTRRYPTANAIGVSGYPSSLQVLVSGVPDPRPGRAGEKYYFLRAIPRDPFAPEQLPAEQTWRLRSYASPATNPQPGSDVFDVHSAATGKALDGTLYANW